MSAVKTAVRSGLFHLAYYLHTVAMLVLVTPICFLLPQRICLAVTKGWAQRSLWLLRVICRIRVEYLGTENLPSSDFILAHKHQSEFGNVRASCGVREPILCYQTRAALRTDLGPVGFESGDDLCFPRCRFGGTQADHCRWHPSDQERAARRHSSGRFAASSRSRASLQVRNRPPLQRAPHPCCANGSQFGALLAMGAILAIPGYRFVFFPAAYRAWSFARSL